MNNDETKTKSQLIAELVATRAALEEVGRGPVKSDALLWSVTETLNEGVVLVAEDHRVLRANSAAGRILGVDRAELEGGSFVGPEWELFDADGKRLPPEEMPGPRAMKEKRSFRDMVLGVKRLDGSTVWVNLGVTPLIGETGRFEGVVGVFSDITEHRQAEDALRKSEEKLRAQSKGIPVLPYTWQKVGNDLTLTGYNAAAMKFTAGGVARIVGAKASEMYRDQPDIIEELWRCVTTGARIERTMWYPLRFRGETRCLDVRYTFVPPDLVMVHTEDVTERVQAEEALRQSEERLRSVIASMDDLVFALNRDHVFTSFDQPERAARLYAAPERFLGKRIDEVMPPHVARLGLEAMEAALATHEVQQFDYALEMGKEERWYSAKVSTRRGQDGTPEGVTVVARDITERKRAEQSLEAAHANLERRVEERTRELIGLREQAEQMAAMRERERLARDLHDAVSQTLFSVSLIAGALPSIWERDPAEGRQRLDELSRMTRGALAEMRGLLLELRPTALVDAELGDLLSQLAESIGSRAGLPVTVKVEGAFAASPELKVALYRITQEALNNVARHASASRAQVDLICGAERLTLTVADDGCGFEPENVSPRHMGLGIMRERAEAAGAELKVDSRPGQGTRVVMEWEAPAGSIGS
jgi:PAS domain S-box-containing protein